MVDEINGLPNVPKAAGPYSQAAAVGDTIFLSGQVALDPESNTIVGTTVEEQAEQVMKNIQNVLQGLGLDFSNIAKTTILLTNIDDFGKVNEIYARWMDVARPARSTYAVAALPLGALIEIEMIAQK